MALVGGSMSPVSRRGACGTSLGLGCFRILKCSFLTLLPNRVRGIMLLLTSPQSIRRGMDSMIRYLVSRQSVWGIVVGSMLALELAELPEG